MNQVRILVFDKTLPGEKGATCFVVGWPDQLTPGDIGYVTQAIATALEVRGIEVTQVTFDSSRHSRDRAKS